MSRRLFFPRFLASLACASAWSGTPVYPADPSGVPQDFICAWRTYAATAVSALRADAAAEARAALQLDVLPCNAPPAPAPVPPPAPAPIAPAATELWVDASAGNDTNPGTPAAPLATVGAALARSRGAPRPAAILIRAGVYRLAAPGAGTLELGAADSGLTIAAAPGAQGAVWLSGALALPPAPTWTPVSQRPAGVEVLPGENAAHGCNASAPGDAVCGCAAAASAAACEARFVGAANATAFTWHDAAQGPTWALKCCLRHDGEWAPVPQAGHVAGRRTPALNIWSTQLDAAALPAGVPELRVNGARVPRARTPNGDPETQQFPLGWVPAGGQQWHPPAPTGPATEVRVSNAALALRNSSQNANYSGGIGGPCVNFSPPFSYWCAAHPAGGGGFQYYIPGGMTLAPGALPAFSSPAGNPAVLQLWRAAHWANWQLEIAGWASDTGVMRFGRGGFQGARGGPGSDFYVENARELLDAPSEYFYDPATGTLFFFPNGTDAAAPPAADTLFEVPTLQMLLRVNASQAAPAAGVTLAGLGFKDAAPTYFEPFGVPSGGDWALARTAAVFVEGSERLAVDACAFSRVGGNALMLSGYNRDARIVNNSARWTGATAFAAWGRTDELADGGARGWDATAGDFPLRTVVEGNLVTETGVWSKQSSCWFQAKAALTTLVGNVCFNLARAGFNFNDGLGGGDEVHRNVIFNSNRESADHGPINSWDRQPYVTTLFDGVTSSARMLPRNISFNMLVANYGGSNGAVDNDDGSLFFENNHNFAVYGHQKFKVGAISSYGNILAYVTDFAGSWNGPGDDGYAPNSMHDNAVIFSPAGSGQYHDCSWARLARGNALYGAAHVSGAGCKAAMTLEQWQALAPADNDVGSTANATLPAAAEIIAWARALLGW